MLQEMKTRDENLLISWLLVGDCNFYRKLPGRFSFADAAA